MDGWTSSPNGERRLANDDSESRHFQTTWTPSSTDQP